MTDFNKIVTPGYYEIGHDSLSWLVRVNKDLSYRSLYGKRAYEQTYYPINVHIPHTYNCFDGITVWNTYENFQAMVADHFTELL